MRFDRDHQIRRVGPLGSPRGSPRRSAGEKPGEIFSGNDPGGLLMTAVLAIARMVIREIFRKKDFYVALVLTAAILFYASQLRFYDTDKVSRYLMELGLFLIFLFSVILA